MLVDLLHERGAAEARADQPPQGVRGAQQPGAPGEAGLAGRQPAEGLQCVGGAGDVAQFVLGGQGLGGVGGAVGLAPGHLEQRERRHQVQVALQPPLPRPLAEQRQPLGARREGLLKLAGELVKVPHLARQHQQPDPVAA